MTSKNDGKDDVDDNSEVNIVDNTAVTQDDSGNFTASQQDQTSYNQENDDDPDPDTADVVYNSEDGSNLTNIPIISNIPYNPGSSGSSVDSQYTKYNSYSGYNGDRGSSYKNCRYVEPLDNNLININIQRNLEHVAQQQRQQIQNVIRNNNEAQQFLSRGAQVIIRMRGLPYDCTAKQVVEFFESGESGVKLLDSEDGVLFVRKPDGRATGDAFVLLSSEDEATSALTKHRELIGSRYIELFRSTTAEVLNRSMDTRHLEQPPMPPLIAQLPPLPPLLPQQSVAHGSRKDCVRLRGLPFEAQVEHVLEFLGEFAKNIMFRGVHMVYNPQGQPSGEAFIQMLSEQAAWACAQHRHHRYMYFGKKQRYIEVFQCSRDDMNLVLSGAIIACPPPTQQTPTSAPTQRSIVPTPGGSPMLSPYGAYPIAAAPPPPTVLSHALAAAQRLTPFPPTIATAYPMYYWPYPSPPVSPTSAYYSSSYSSIATTHTIIPSECIPMHPSGDLSMHPEAVATM